MPESSFLLYIINKRNVSRLCRMNKLQEATYFPPISWRKIVEVN